MIENLVLDEKMPSSELGKRLMAMGQMAATLAHEIRNPLGSMELCCSLLKKDLRGQEEVYNLAEQIHSSIHRLNHIISNCLQFSKDFRPQLKRHENIVGFITGVESLVLDYGRKKSVEVSFENKVHQAVWIDEYLLGQALSNVLINAIDSYADIRADEKIRRVSCKIELVAEELEFTVSDDGCGIPQATLDSVFDPFVSTKASGTGLGLSIVHAIVTAHRGQVKLESQEGIGSSFKLSFPQQVKNNDDILPELNNE